jgi:pSer/pThr/pTyr-binding forkhead associated (FHA) protein
VREQDAKIKQLESDAAERMGRTIFASERVSPIPPAPSSDPITLENPAKLLPLDGDNTPIVLDRKVMTVGRTRDNHVFVQSQLASRDHARILVSEENVVVFDIGSANGCFVNDEQIRRHTLRDGDIVRFADRGYRFCA